jgi:hypothetical protein
MNRAKKSTQAQELAYLHLQGLSFRSLAQTYEISVGGAHAKVAQVLTHLPHCADVSLKYCSRFCGILLVDGKYVAVKGYERKIPVLYGVDYLTHDIPTYTLSVAENYQTCISFFQSLRLLNYPLQAMVCDDNINIYQACLQVYPHAIIQLCQNHYKESIRKNFQVRTDATHRPFVQAIEELFKKKRAETEFKTMAQKMVKYFGTDPEYLCVMGDIFKRFDKLCGYMNLKHVPQTTNLIESFNSHLQGRLKTIKGFESFRDADTWLNGYFLHRRLKKYTDCEGKFKRLNGHSSLEKTIADPSCLYTLLHLLR